MTDITAPADGDLVDPAWAASITAAVNQMQNYLTLLDSANSAWTDWSSSFSIQSTGTQPTQGSSTYSARYKQIGKTVLFSFKATLNTFTAGSGTYRIPVPVTPLNPADIAIGRIYVQDFGTALYTGTCFFNSGSDTYLSMILQNATGALLGSAGPGTAWANSDVIAGSISYESA